MILVSNWPALPTNGSPCAPSSAPGASPTNMSCASMSHTPKTTFLREEARCGHLTHDRARSRNSAKAADFASELNAGSTVAGVSISDGAIDGAGLGSGGFGAATGAGAVRLVTSAATGAD